MAEIVNLRMARKRKVRTLKDRQAEANRTIHGRSKAQKTADRIEQERAARHLDGHKRSDDTP